MEQANKSIVFEQPINESIRICLRLEHLFKQIDRNLENNQSILNLEPALISLVRILEVIDRPDLKSKLTQTLTQQATTLSQLVKFPQVNTNRLSETLLQLDALIDKLHNTNGKIATHLRANEFLSQVRLQLATPGGATAFNAPSYHLWQYQPLEYCSEQLQQWLKDVEILRDTAELILRLTRESTTPQTIVAKAGFHYQTLNPSLPCQMIRVIIPATNIFPAMSVGKHRVNIRFLVPNYSDGGHTVQLQHDLEFELACCRI